MRYIPESRIADALGDTNPLGVKPGDIVQWNIGRHHFTAVMTSEDGIHTGRSRWMVGCTTCEVLLHEATTGPVNNATAHVRRKDGGR